MLCVLFFCVLLWEKEHTHSMIQHTNNSVGSFFSHRAHRVHWAFLRTVRAHRTPSAYRVHRAFQLKMGVRFCDIGWLNVSVECCVFCSSVFFCEKKNIVGVCVDSFFSHRAHRVHWAFLRTVSRPQNASGIQSSQSVTAKDGCKVLWNRLT